jgi:hypothetical protein
MSGDWRKNRGLWLVVGVAAGFLVGGLWPDAPLHAVATAQQESFAMATCPVDGSSEAVFFLDSLTGDLKAAVLSPQTGKFLSFFAYNILADLGVDATKDPKFLLVTGVNDFRRTPGSNQLGTSVVYVAEVTSGKVAAYGIPWSKQRNTDTRPFEGPLIPLDMYQFRNVVVREP